MILFKDDWVTKHPYAIVDYNTKNKSFLRTAGIFKKMGVENAEFILALHNPNLVGVDPHSPTLTEQEVIWISKECNENFWYFIREVVRVPATGSPEPVQFRANRGNIALYWLFLNHITSMLIQPRQTGKSISTDILMMWILEVGAVNVHANLLTKDDALRTNNVKRLKELMDNLPRYLDLRSKKDTNNTEKVTIKRIDNMYTSSVGQASPKAALNLGRGMTIAINQIDEIAFVNNIDVTLPALLAASGAARDNAKAAGAPYGNIFTTTAGFLSSNSGRYAKKIYDNSFRWTELFYDLQNEEELNAKIKLNSPGEKVQVLLEYNHRQLGYTDEWLRTKIAEAMAEGDDAAADFLLIWAEGNERSPIHKDMLKIIKNSKIPEPIIETSDYGYITRWYVPQYRIDSGLADSRLVMSLDTSDAVGKDDIGMVIRDSNTGETVAAGVYNETNLITFSEWIMDWLIRFDNLTLIIERRSSGVAIIDNLIKLCLVNNIDPFARIFNWVVNDHHINSKYAEEVVNVSFNRRSDYVYEKYRDKFGFATSGNGRASRGVLYGEIFNGSVKYTGSTVRDITLVEQLSGLTIRNDRIDHKSGSHDDLVIAWLLGYWFLSKTDNKSFYGLKPNKVLGTVINAMVNEQGGEEGMAAKEYQVALKAEIDDLLDRVSSERNKIKSAILTNKIKYLYKNIDTKIIPNFNLESLLENIELNKRNTAVNNKEYWKYSSYHSTG